VRHFQNIQAGEANSRDDPSSSHGFPIFARRLIPINLRDWLEIAVAEKEGKPLLYFDRLHISDGQWELDSSFGIGFRHAGDISRAIEGLAVDGGDRIISLDGLQRLMISIKSSCGIDDPED
jgi:hypothetical protein